MITITTLKDKYANLEEVKLNTALKQNTLKDIITYSELGFNIIPLYRYAKNPTMPG